MQRENTAERVRVECVVVQHNNTTGGGMNTMRRAKLKKGFVTR